MHATRIARDVAADRAILLRGRIGRIEPTLRLRRALDVRDLGAALHVGHARLLVDRDPIKGERIEHPPAAHRRRGTRQRRAAAARRDRHAVPIGQREHHTDVGLPSHLDHGLRPEGNLRTVEGGLVQGRRVGHDDATPQFAFQCPGCGRKLLHDGISRWEGRMRTQRQFSCKQADTPPPRRTRIA